MAYTTINKSTDYFNTKLYTGNGSSQSITGVGFTQDFTWIKIRSEVNHNRLMDTVRGATKELYSDLTSAEVTGANGLTSFDSDGFSLGTDNAFNKSSATYASWNWKANGTGSANTDGTINSTVSANTTAGFSIVSFTGNSTSGATVGHGLGAVPKMIILKLLSGSDNWTIYHSSLGNTKRLELNNANAPSTSATAGWNNTSPTTSVFSLGNNGQVNGSGQTYIAYCFAEKTGYSKFGSYTGNGSTDGTFVYTGFKPAFIMIKKSNAGDGWFMYDNKREGYNQQNNHVMAHSNAAETTGGSVAYIDILSNGFKCRSTNGNMNASGDSYITMCFAEAPLVGTNNVPCTAR